MILMSCVFEPPYMFLAYFYDGSNVENDLNFVAIQVEMRCVTVKVIDWSAFSSQ